MLHLIQTETHTGEYSQTLRLIKDLTTRIVQQWCMLAGVRMEHVQISTYPLKEQLQLLSQATVMVSNIGSRSFRLIYLPNGASTILVGPPEYHPLLEHPNLPPISAGPAGSFSMYSYTRSRSTYASDQHYSAAIDC